MTEPIPFKLWSQPFRFIFLPWILVFLVIFYWFSFVPLLFAYYIGRSHPNTTGKYVFLLIQLAIFIVIVSVLVYVWRRHPRARNTKHKHQNNDYCSVARLEDGLETCDDCVDLPEIAEKLPMLTIDLNKPAPEEVCIRSRTVHDDHRPLSQNLEVALTPRELFFRDLYETVFETDSAITRHFIQREREHSSRDLESARCSLSSPIYWELLSRSSLNGSVNKSVSNEPTRSRKSSRYSTAESKLDGKDQVSEFFVANVVPKKSETSEVFLFVCDESEKPERVTRNVSLHTEDDEVFQK